MKHQLLLQRANNAANTIEPPGAYSSVVILEIDSSYGAKIDVIAPGKVFSTWIDGYKALRGTSMAVDL